jgi:hypothetical protein
MLLIVFSKKILVYECGLIINKENILAPGAIIPNKPLDNNKENHKKYCQTTASLLLAGASIENIRKVLVPKVYVNPKTKIPEYIYDLFLAWDAREADKLLPYKACDHKIKLLPGKLLPAGPLYNISKNKLLVLCKFLDENLAKGFICTSVSPAVSLVLFAKKPGGGFRFYIDYYTLNTIIIKNYYPLSLIQEILARLSRAKIYMKLDIIAVFNHIYIAEKQEYLIVFNIYYGLYKTLVILFGLLNTFIIFQAYINKVLHLYLDVFCITYINNILVYSNNLTSYKQHVRLVIKVL